MNYRQLRRRVERAEWLVQGRADDTEVHWATLKRAWHEGWTPVRILGAGLITGFIAGKLEPSKGKVVASQATRWLQLFSTVSGMVTAVRAQQASHQAEAAGEQAERAADNAEAVAVGEAPGATVASPASADGRRRAAAEETYATAPRPAEAATEVSER